MKIIHVVALASPDGAYGGPLRVAMNQVKALRESGHDAILIAGQAGYGPDVPEAIDDAPARLFPAEHLLGRRGFGSLTSPRLLRWLRDAAPRVDILHVHLARDFLTARAALVARSAGVPYVVQTHGMIRPPRNTAQRLFDAAVTRRALAGAQRIYALNVVEVAQLEAVGANPGGIAVLPNGVGLPPPPVPASGPGRGPEGLFLGRLHRRKRPLAFAEAAIAIAERHSAARFAIVGPDEGERAGVEAAVRSAPREVRERVTVEGPLGPEQTLARIARSDFFVLPSIDEPFGMAAVEAMSVGKPVVVTTSCGLADDVRAHSAGLVVGSGREELRDAMERLVSDGALRRRLGANGRRLVEDRFTMDRVVRRLLDDYAESIELVRGR